MTDREQPNREALWLNYLYKTHSEETLRRWCRTLRYFRFCRADADGTNGDRLLLFLRFSDATEYNRIATTLDLPLPDFKAGPPVRGAYNQPDVPGGVPMWHATTTAHSEPVEVMCWGWSCLLMLTSLDNLWTVDEETAARAGRLERLLEPLKASWVDPPSNGSNCISPSLYPEWFRS